MSNEKRINWGEVLTNSKVRDAYKRFAAGKSSAREVEKEFKNTPHSGTFRAIIRTRGAARARDAARLALSRRTTKKAS